MTVATRWWAPVEPGIGPDPFDLSLLESGGEPDKDLGQQLLALHRVGAAACEAVATQPLADEVTLRGVLATAREMVALPAVEAISKVYDDQAYGTLLLRDVLDDAEQAAISLYRTCITKQMAPSMAAHRVGLVYGVPLRELGRYSMVATDPKSNKQVVEELADKTLLGFVGKMVTEEAPQGVKQLVSKAPARERDATQTRLLQGLFDRAEAETATTPDDPATPYHDARNRGRFAVEGTTAAPKEVGGTKLERKTLSRTSLKRTQLARAETPKGKLTGAALAGGRLESGSTRGRLSRGRMTPAARKMQALLAEIEPETVPLDGGDGEDYLSHRPDRNAGEHTDLWQEASFVFPTDLWLKRKAGMAVTRDDDGNESIMFRARALADGGPYMQDSHDHLSGDHAHARKTIAEVIHAREDHKGQPPPEVHRIPGAAHRLTDRREIKALKERYLEQMEEKFGKRLNKATEIGFVLAAGDHDNPEDLVLVWQPPTPGKHVLDRPVKAITEVFIEEESTRGVDNSSDVGTDTIIDPNLALQVLGGRMLWRDDDKGGYLIKQYDAIRTDEDSLQALARDRQRRTNRRGFGKRLVVSKAVNERNAAQLAQLQGLFDRAAQAERDWHGKDPGERSPETGEFQRVGTSLSRATLQRTSLKRAELKRGGKAKLAGASLEGGKLEQGRLTTGGLDRASLKQVALAAAQGSDEQTVFLDPSFDYHVLDSQQVQFLLGDSDIETDGRFFEDVLEEAYHRPFKPGFGASAMISDKWKITTSEETRETLIGETDHRLVNAPFPNKGGLWKDTGINAVISDDKALAGLALEVENYLADHPDVQLVRSVITKVSDQRWRVRVMADNAKIGHAHMIRFDGLPDGAIQLRPEAPRRLTNAKGIEHWLMMRFHGGKQLGSGGSTDYMPVPTVVAWAIEKAGDEP